MAASSFLQVRASKWLTQRVVSWIWAIWFLSWRLMASASWTFRKQTISLSEKKETIKTALNNLLLTKKNNKSPGCVWTILPNYFTMCQISKDDWDFWISLDFTMTAVMVQQTELKLHNILFENRQSNVCVCNSPSHGLLNQRVILELNH